MFAKLDIASRAQLAAEVTRHRDGGEAAGDGWALMPGAAAVVPGPRIARVPLVHRR